MTPVAQASWAITDSNIGSACDTWATSVTVNNYGNIADWNTASVSKMASCIFRNKPTFNADISKWNVACVTTMNSLFNQAGAFNADISKWNVARVVYMTETFNGATAFNQNIASWNVARVGNMYLSL